MKNEENTKLTKVMTVGISVLFLTGFILFLTDGMASTNGEIERAVFVFRDINDIPVAAEHGLRIILRDGARMLVEGDSNTLDKLENLGYEIHREDSDTSAWNGLDNLSYLDTDDSINQDYPFPNHYPSVQELYDWYDDIVLEFPDLVTKTHIGYSYEGRDLWMLEITSNEDVQVSYKPGFLIDGNMHTREWSGNQVSSYFMWRILNEYNTNETIYWLLNNRRIYVMPMQNPDGYIFDGDGELGDDGRGGNWRKNRNASTPTTAVGVDLNRNWDIMWSSGNSDPSADDYHGEAPFSEYENWHLRDFMLEKGIDSYQNIHSYAGTLLIPLMYSSDPSPHDQWYRGMAGHMTSLTSIMGNEGNHYSYGQPHEEIGYSAPGGAGDWVYDAMGAQALVYELETGGDGFYPSVDKIMTINTDVDESLIYQARVSDVDLGDGTNLLFPPIPYILYGTVTDTGGFPVVGNTVTLENMVTAETRSINTDSNGYYELNYGTLVEHGYTLTDTFSVSSGTAYTEFTIGEEWGQRIDLVTEPDGDPPDITVTRPTGGETWYADEQESITWTTTQGDGTITGVDLEYTVNNGASWNVIVTGIPDSGSHLWTVPDIATDQARIRATVHDDEGRRGNDISGVFTIVGTPPEPPAPPENLAVEHYGTGMETLFYDDVEGGDLGYTTGTSESPASEWGIRQHGATSGVNSWDFGDGQYYKTSAYGYLSWLISPGIEIPTGAENVELSFEHWRDFGMQTTYLDGGNLKLSTTGTGGTFNVITPNVGYDGPINDAYGNPLGGQQAWGGTVGWETVTFDLSAYTGETIHLRWDAGIEAYDEDFGAGWRIDNILVTAETPGEGDEHNRLTWDASPDDPSDVAQYNVYRSEESEGTYEYVESVSADGSASYEYLDLDKGLPDGIIWWYIVRAEGLNGVEEENTNAVPEPGEETIYVDIPLYAGGDAEGWNFVSFNLMPLDTTLEAILADIDGNYNKLMYFDASTGEWSSYIPGRAARYNNLGMWTHRIGLWIHMATTDTLTVEGYAHGSTDITLYPGWTMVGLPSESTGNHGLPGEIDRIGYFDASAENNLAYNYDPGSFAFEPLKGYWIHNPSDATVIWTVDY